MVLVEAIVIFYALQLALAATPGLIVLVGGRRRILSCMLLVGALMAIGLPVYLDWLSTERMAAQGMFRDDIESLFVPWFFAILSAIVGGLVAAVFVALTKERERDV